MPLYATTKKNMPGGDDLVPIAWSYLEPEHVQVYVDGVVAGFSFQSASVIQLDVTPSAGQIAKVMRVTPVTTVPVDYNDGSALEEADLDRGELAMIYIAQEIYDRLTESVTEDFFTNLDANGRRIINVGDPVDEGDAVNLGWIENLAFGQVRVRDTVTAITGTIFSNDNLTTAIITLGYYAVGDAGKPLLWVRQPDPQSVPTSGTYVQSADGDYWVMADDTYAYGPTGSVVPDNNAVAADLTNPMGATLQFAGRITSGLPEANGGTPTAPGVANPSTALLFRFPAGIKLANSPFVRASVKLHIPCPSDAGSASVKVDFHVRQKAAAVSEHVYVEKVELGNDPLDMITGVWLLPSFTEDEPYGIAVTLNGHGANQVGEIDYVLDLDVRAASPLPVADMTRLATVGGAQVTNNDSLEAVNLLLEGALTHVSSGGATTDETPAGGLKRTWRFDTAANLALDTAMTYNRVAVGDDVWAEGRRYTVAASGEASPDVTTAGGVKLLSADVWEDFVQVRGYRTITGATTLTADDARKLIICDFASDATVTLPQGLPIGTPIHFLSINATGLPTLAAGGAETLGTAETNKLEKQFAISTAMVYDTGAWVHFGKLEAAP